MTYPSPLAAALTGATLRQLAYWRRDSAAAGPLLVPQHARRPRALYSYQDIVALRMFVQLRQETSLQRIRKAVSWLQQHHPDTHMSEHTLKASGRTIIWISSTGEYFDVVDHPGQPGFKVVMEQIFGAFRTRNGREVPNLFSPAVGVSVDPKIRSGYPVVAGTRIPYDVIAGLAGDGLSDAEIRELYPRLDHAEIDGATAFAAMVREATESPVAA